MQTRKDFSRLQEEHAKAIQASRDKVEKCEQFKSDYEALQARLYSLPDEIRHDIMVPFGKFAFMPGKLYHTNEILVLLGDNWFVKTSAKHALEITERRKQFVTEIIDKERKQFQDWESRHTFTEGFQRAMEEHQDTIEIKEDYKPQVGTKKARKAWVPKVDVPPPRRVYPRRQPSTDSCADKSIQSSSSLGRPVGGATENVATPVLDLDSSSAVCGQLSSNTKGKQEVWKRLEELNVQEERDELKEVEEEKKDEIGLQISGSAQDSVITKPVCTQSKHSPPVSKVRDIEMDEAESNTLPLKIAVRHTPTTSEHPQQTETETAETQEKELFTSPADIFSHFIAKDSDSEDAEDYMVTSDHKQVKWGKDLKIRVRSTIRPAVSAVRKRGSFNSRPQVPFTGQVVEKAVPKHTSTTTDKGPGKTSRFKEARRKK